VENVDIKKESEIYKQMHLSALDYRLMEAVDVKRMLLI